MAWMSKQVLDLEFPPPDPGSLVPVYFRDMDRAIGQSDASDAFAFPPPPVAIQPPEPGDLGMRDPMAGDATVKSGEFCELRRAVPTCRGRALQGQ
jgi:hypothetical protein